MEAVNLKLHGRQKKAYEIFMRPHRQRDGKPLVRRILYGGAKGGGKSHWLCWMLLLYALWVIRECALQRSQYPIALGFVGRLRSIDFKGTTLETWKRVIPDKFYRIYNNEEIIILDAVKYEFGGLDSQNAINKFNSAEYAIVALDQAEECPRDKVSTLLGTLRLKIGERALPYKAVFTANPAACWLKDEFITRKDLEPEDHFVQALPADNPFLAPGYVEHLERTFSYRPELLAAYLRGSWTALAAPNQIVLEEWLEVALSLKRVIDRPRRFIVCDPAREGDDECVAYLMCETVIVGQKIWGKILSDRLNNELHKWALEEEVDAVVIEDNGLGGPIVDWQRSLAGSNYQVIGVNVAGESKKVIENRPEYANLRAEIWMESARALAQGDIALSGHCLSEDDLLLLRNQITQVSYDFRGNKIIVMGKDEIKKILGRSPDRADAAMIGWWVLPRITRRTATDGKRRAKRRSAMAA